MHSTIASRDERRLVARIVESLDSALLFASVVCHVAPVWLDAQDMLALWRVGHSHALGCTDSAERDLRPATQLLAIAQRSAGGTPAHVYLSRAVLDVGNLTALRHARLALLHLAANLSAASEIAGETHRLQLCALDDADSIVIVEQYPRPRLLRLA